MRPSPSTSHPLVTLAVTVATTVATIVAAMVASLAVPMPARAMDITIFGHGVAGSGSGKHVDVARKIGTFSTLQLEGPLDVDAHPGATPGVTVHADDDVEPLIETVVEGDALVVRPRKGASFYTGHKILVEVTFPALSATRQTGNGDLHVSRVEGARLDSSISGAGDLRIDDAEVGNFTLRISGSGDVRIAGHADEARYAVSGSGDIDAVKLSVRRLDIDVAGSGDVRANATEAIDARVSGSGDVVYAGHPHDVSRFVTGSGSVSALH